jgi:RecA/RadA recombinase
MDTKMDTKRPGLSVLKRLINKEHGSGTIGSAGSVKNIPRLSTGSLSFDRALGGGIAVGRTTIFAGDESSGKTTNALRVIGLAQNICANCYRPVKDLSVSEVVDSEGDTYWSAEGKCDCFSRGIFKPIKYDDEKESDFKKRLERYKENSYEEFSVVFFDPEGTFDKVWAAKLGVDIRRLLYVQAETTEEVCDIYESLVRTGEIDLFVLDSIAAMTPSAEIENSLAEWQQGLQARLMNKFIRKVLSSITSVMKSKGRAPTHIWINQFREKIGGSSFGDNRVMTSGKGQLFFASTIVNFWTSKWTKEEQDKDIFGKDLMSEIGTRVKVSYKTEKNKTAPAKQMGSYYMWIAGDNAGEIDELKYVIGMASKLNMYREVGEGSNKTWYVGNEKYTRKKDAMARIEEPATFEKLRKILLDRILDGKI